MNAAVKRPLAWAAGGSLLVAACLGGYAMRMLGGSEPVALVACAGERSTMAWPCRQMLGHVVLDERAIERLNMEAGAQYPALVDDPDRAAALLQLLLAHGLDINARDRRSHDRTALHIAAADGRVDRARLLVEHGARPGVFDDAGRTPLDVARNMAARYPGDPHAARMVGYLESVPGAVVDQRYSNL